VESGNDPVGAAGIDLRRHGAYIDPSTFDQMRNRSVEAAGMPKRGFEVG
jgi:hypothetical protein